MFCISHTRLKAIKFFINSQNQEFIPRFVGNAIKSIRPVSNSAAYDGDGKTTVNVLNHDESPINLINTYSHKGFRLHNNLFITGSILLFPTNVFSWNVRKSIDITLDSLLIFDLIVPKTKIVIIGYGQYGEDYDASIPSKLKKKGISCEMLATPQAITTYNYLAHDSVHVAGAFIPITNPVKMEERDKFALEYYDTVYGDNDLRQRVYREEMGYQKDMYMKNVKRGVESKSKFDD